MRPSKIQYWWTGSGGGTPPSGDSVLYEDGATAHYEDSAIVLYE